MSNTLAIYVFAHSKSKTPISIFQHALCWFHQTLDPPDVNFIADDFACQDNDRQKAILAAHIFYSYFAYGSPFERAQQCAEIIRLEPEFLIP